MIKVWKIDPGGIRVAPQLWPECRDEGYIAIGWVEIGNLLHYPTEQAIHAALVQHYPNQPNPTNNAGSCWSFVHSIQVGDIVIANTGVARVLGIGVVTSSYFPPSHPQNPRRLHGHNDDYLNVRSVDWVAQFPQAYALPQGGINFAVRTVRNARIQIDAQGNVLGNAGHIESRINKDTQELLRQIFV